MTAPLFFTGADDFRRWLEAHHASASELWVLFRRKGHPDPGMSYPEAVDEALCFGWIDGIRKKVDETSYTNRFTPRKRRSNWSRVNIARVGELENQGRMHPAGRAAFEARSEANSGVYSFEREAAALPPDFEHRFRGEPEAWAFFERQPPYYRRISAYWVMSARRDETRERRLARLIDDSREGLWIALLRRNPSK
jgi:uncharacterized protein YdeI (YjbR/CyaY-like superfamily)